MKKITTKDITLIAMFTALTALLSQISVPIPFSPVPINLALLSVFIAGGLLGGIKGGMSQLIFLLIGSIGIPVFAGFNGGIGTLVGPTGGYLIGYIIAAVIIGFMCKNRKTILWCVISIVIGLTACYLFGTAWFMFISKNNLITSLTACVLPFLPGDAIKIAIASLLVNRLSKIMKKSSA